MSILSARSIHISFRLPNWSSRKPTTLFQNQRPSFSRNGIRRATNGSSQISSQPAWCQRSNMLSSKSTLGAPSHLATLITFVRQSMISRAAVSMPKLWQRRYRSYEAANSGSTSSVLTMIRQRGPPSNMLRSSSRASRSWQTSRRSLASKSTKSAPTVSGRRQRR